MKLLALLSVACLLASCGTIEEQQPVPMPIFGDECESISYSKGCKDAKKDKATF